jgi:hypothetical protein
MTPTASPPAFSTASASTPIRPTLPPPYTNPMLLRTNSAPISSAAARYSGRLPGLEPQKTQIRLMQPFYVSLPQMKGTHQNTSGMAISRKVA